MTPSIILMCAISLTDLQTLNNSQLKLVDLRIQRTIHSYQIGRFWEKGSYIGADPKYAALLEDQQAGARDVMRKTTAELTKIFDILEKTKETCK